MLSIVILTTGVDAGPATGGLRPAWVSGSPANLAASALATAIFDLGPDWRGYPYAQIFAYSVAPSSGFIGFEVRASDTAADAASRRLGPAYGAASATVLYAPVTTVTTSAGVVVRPAGRYLVLKAINNDAVNAQGPTANFTLALYPC